MVPSVLAVYGVLSLFMWTERGSGLHPELQEMSPLLAAVMFATVWSLTAPASRKLASTSGWPRLVAVSGVCLLCAGLLLLWIALANSGGVLLHFLSGALTGLFCPHYVIYFRYTHTHTYPLDYVTNLPKCAYMQIMALFFLSVFRYVVGSLLFAYHDSHNCIL